MSRQSNNSSIFDPNTPKNPPQQSVSNPIVNAAITGAGILAATVSTKILTAVWSAVFGEEPPSEKAAKQSAKEVKKARKQAKKDGLSKAEIQEIRDPQEDVAPWKTALWTALSALFQGFEIVEIKEDGLWCAIVATI